MLQRLENKGYIERDRSLPVHLFSAKISRQIYARGQMESLAAKLTGGSLAPLITYLVEGRSLSSKEISRLAQNLPMEGAKEVVPTLEDAYMWLMGSAGRSEGDRP
ncbi:MAG: BlaI/MecI/CopY family transcriptional regulator [Acidobacteria bacterium]|nr:BlaI/MecI/CopY family transcriptional regulator [Acidobacteriota bacterium]MBU4494695.1 BlaI/MecI/CopY family transcriptional regulator [Acidobacteriota bacterium]